MFCSPICARLQLAQIADWLEGYARSLDLDVWTSSTVTRATQDPETKKWTVEIEHANTGPRSFVVNHLVFATGFAGGSYNMPQIPGAVRVFARRLNRLLTFSARKSLKAKFHTLSITRRPKITREKKYSWWAPVHPVCPCRLRRIRLHLCLWNKMIGHDIAKELHDHGVGAFLILSVFVRGRSDQRIFRCDNVSA
jgi:hypothetical protein